MRNISPEWRDLTEGFMRIEALEARFRNEWSLRLEGTRRKNDEAMRQTFREQGRAALTAACVMAILLFVVALIFSALFSPFSPAVLVMLILTLAVPAFLALCGIWSLLLVPDSAPDISNLSGEWWAEISEGVPAVRRSAPALSAREVGDDGEAAFVAHLNGTLPEEYVAVRNLLMARSLDADAIVAAPTGIWVYEVKNWVGDITCENGKWQRMNEPIKWPFDKQWIKEAAIVKEALRRGLPEHPDIHEAVGGGLVFTQSQFSLSVDGSCEAPVYTPGTCVEALSGFSEIPGFTMEMRLRAIDALIAFSDRAHEQKWRSAFGDGILRRVG
ncbi:MAG: NERD domain-containing protein [Rubrobacteraceae bacterium]